jgi:hypothetical protein
LVFAPFGVGDGSTTFGLPNRAYLGVGRDNASGSASNVNQVSTTITLTNGSATATVASATGLAVGMYISHPKVLPGSSILTISGTTLTLSNTATGSVSGSAVRFSWILDAQTLGTVGGALTQSTTLVTANLPAYTPSGSVFNFADLASQRYGLVIRRRCFNDSWWCSIQRIRDNGDFDVHRHGAGRHEHANYQIDCPADNRHELHH